MLTRRGRAAVAVAALVAVAAASQSAGSVGTPGPTGGAAEQQESGSATPVALDEVGFPGDRPNIVVIMADDMRDDEIRWMPNVQRLIGDEGVRFVNSFSPHPLCCPARASFLSGQYTHNHGVWSNTDPYGFGAFDDRRTVATDLADAGYHTGFVGKYLNGYGESPNPNGRGTDSLTYVPPGWTDWRGAAEGTYHYWRTTLNVNGELRNPGRVYQTRMFGAESDDVLSRFAGSPQPFFLWASYVAPHTGLPAEDDDPETPLVRDDGEEIGFSTPARPYSVRGMFDDEIREAPGGAGERDVSDKPWFIRGVPPANAAERDATTALTRQRAESLHILDEEVADTVEKLEELGELDNTVVVFTSDNGFFLGEHRQRLGKLLAYDPSLRTPTLVRGPGIPAGGTRTDPFITPDFGPTFLDVAAAPADPEMDGVSLLDVARTGDRGWTRPVLTESGPLRRVPGVERPELLLDEPNGPNRTRSTQGVRTQRYLYVEHISGERELYDLRADPDQLVNVVDRPGSARVVRRLAATLDRLRTCQAATCTL